MLWVANGKDVMNLGGILYCKKRQGIFLHLDEWVVS
jgi:hypothetical protein